MIKKHFNQPISIRGNGAEQDSLQISFSSKRVKGTFRVYYFKDHEHFIAYMPSLQLTGYGDNKKEAVDMLFDVVLDDFFENMLEQSVAKANSLLSSLGWERNKLFHKKFKSNSFVDKEGVLRNFNLPVETKIESEILITS
jgi:hypothetical protein